jgi:RNA polymerase sigma factor (sigma-70 family)
MDKIKSGDIDKMTLLYKRYANDLYRFAYHQLRDQNTSEDVVQSVFYRILKYKETFKGDGFKTWMYHIARNVIIDAKKRNNLWPTDDITSIGDKNFVDNTEVNFEKAQNSQLISKAMSTLPYDQYEILTLSKYEEMSYKDIGVLLGISESNVKVKVHRAIKQLKEAYLKLDN